VPIRASFAETVVHERGDTAALLGMYGYRRLARTDWHAIMSAYYRRLRPTQADGDVPESRWLDAKDPDFEAEADSIPFCSASRIHASLESPNLTTPVVMERVGSRKRSIIDDLVGGDLVEANEPHYARLTL